MASMSKDSQETSAKKRWELENSVQTVNTDNDLFKYDIQEQQDILTAKPWEKDPHYFKEIKISAIALLNMVIHARSGGVSEIMGLLLGKVKGNTLIVMNSFDLPVEGTETRVNAQAQAYEYMTSYMESAKLVGRLENVIGWYHSHPGYGCWLSGIDVSTQMLHQNFQDPFVAVVVDPIQTISAGKVCLGAFRTYPKGFKAANEEPSEYQTIPLNKIKDFGTHFKHYYSLEVKYFKSSLDCHLLDILWSKFWINTLSSSRLITNTHYLTGQINDISKKLELVSNKTDQSEDQSKVENTFEKATKDSNKVTTEVLCGFLSQTVKEALFSSKIFKNN